MPIKTNPGQIQSAVDTGLPFTPVTGTGGTGALSYSVAPALPAGLSMNPATGAISGVPTALSPSTTYTVTVTDANSATAATTFSLTVSPAVIATTVALSSSTTTAFIGQAVTLTATVSPTPTGGTVTFTDGATVLCNAVALTGATAACTPSFTTGGTHNVIASYSGQGVYAASTSAAVAIAVTNQTQQTVEAIAGFMSHRNDLIVSNAFDETREIDRLEGAGGGAGEGGSNLAEGQTAGSSANGASRLGMGEAPNVAGLIAGMSGGRGARAGSSLAANFASSTPDAAHPTGGPLAVTGGGDDTSLRLGFATSLSAVMKNEAAKDVEKLKAAGLGFGADKPPSQKATALPLDIWVEGKYSGLTGTKTDGHFGLVTLGADYVVNRSLLVGIYAQYDSLHEKNDTKVTEVEGQGFMVGPYFTLRLTDRLYWQGRAAWGTSSVDVSPFQTYTDSFGTERWMGSTKLTGRWRLGAWVLSPAASVTYLEDTSDAYRDTFGALIPSVRSELGQAKIGPEVGYSYTTAGGIMLEPHGKLELIWDFANDVRAQGLSVVTNESEAFGDVRGRAELGLRGSTPGDLGFDLSAAYDGLGSSAAGAVTGTAMMRVPLN